MKVYQHIAQALEAAQNCERTGNVEWNHRHRDFIYAMVRDYMPSGSGFDWGTGFDDESTPDRLIFTTRFHHMNDGGYYDGTTDHRVIVTPSLAHGFEFRVTGRDRNDIKDYIGDCFHTSLDMEVTPERLTEIYSKR